MLIMNSTIAALFVASVLESLATPTILKEPLLLSREVEPQRFPSLLLLSQLFRTGPSWFFGDAYNYTLCLNLS